MQNSATYHGLTLHDSLHRLHVLHVLRVVHHGTGRRSHGDGDRHTGLLLEVGAGRDAAVPRAHELRVHDVNGAGRLHDGGHGGRGLLLLAGRLGVQL